MNDVLTSITRDISIEAPWSLIEAFATQPREKPEDGNRGAEMIADRLRGFGVPVTVYEPDLYLSLPISASVEADGVTEDENGYIVLDSTKSKSDDLWVANDRNYNVGFVTVADVPYVPMVRAAKALHSGMYERRFGD